MRNKILSLLRDCTPFFINLQEENRQEIIALLMEKGALNVNEITENINLSRPAVSHHLKILRQTDLVLVEKKGKERFYSLNLECIKNNLSRFNELMENKAE